jgi:hypothetical protein
VRLYNSGKAPRLRRLAQSIHVVWHKGYSRARLRSCLCNHTATCVPRATSRIQACWKLCESLDTGYGARCTLYFTCGAALHPGMRILVCCVVRTSIHVTRCIDIGCCTLHVESITMLRTARRSCSGTRSMRASSAWASTSAATSVLPHQHPAPNRVLTPQYPGPLSTRPSPPWRTRVR